jgi:hypothetical protein
MMLYYITKCNIEYKRPNHYVYYSSFNDSGYAINYEKPNHIWTSQIPEDPAKDLCLCCGTERW